MATRVKDRGRLGGTRYLRGTLAGCVGFAPLCFLFTSYCPLCLFFRLRRSVFTLESSHIILPAASAMFLVAGPS